MADTTTNKNFLSVIAATSDKLENILIKDGQLIFIQDLTRLAFDFKGQRKFYNQLTTLDTDVERLSLSSPLKGYYFVINTAILWFYDNGWIQITEKPSQVIFVGVELPELGQGKEGTLYVNKADKEIAIYDGSENEYIIVADKTQDATSEDIAGLFD